MDPDTGEKGGACEAVRIVFAGAYPLISVFGGKLTTYRHLGEDVLDRLMHRLGRQAPAWTAHAVLPGGDFPPGGPEAYARELAARHPYLPEALRHRYLRTYGTRTESLLGEARSLEELGRDCGDGLYAAEVRYLMRPLRQNSCRPDVILNLGVIRMDDGSVRRSIQEQSGGEVAPSSLRADGGLMRNAFVCQFLADMLDRPLEIPRNTEITAWGAACLAGLEAGVFRDLDSLAATWEAGRRYRPQLDAELRERYYQGWQQALAMGL